MLKPVGVLWGTRQVERKSIDTSADAFKDACQNSLAILGVLYTVGPNRAVTNM